MHYKNTKISIVRRKFAYEKRKSNSSPKLQSQPLTVHIAFRKGYKSKFTYFMHTIDFFEDHVDPIQKAIDNLLLPTLGTNEVHLLVTLMTA